MFSFNHNFKIVHNNFQDKNFQKAIKRRIKLFQKYHSIMKKYMNLSMGLLLTLKIRMKL